MTSGNGEPTCCITATVATMSERYFYGWNVVAATFVMALFSFGLGFYGLNVYVATLYPGGRSHRWPRSRDGEARVPRRSLLSIGPLCRLCATRSRSPARPLFGDGVRLWPATAAWLRYI